MTFAVKDTGIGMPQDKMNNLFQPFTQLEYNISRKRDGAGLGLAIGKKFVELVGGEIWTESQECKGSTIRFAIPAESSRASNWILVRLVEMLPAKTSRIRIL